MTPSATAAGAIAANSRVLPVPLAGEWYALPRHRDRSAPLNILWNHRWEYDKAPQRFFAALDRLRQQGTEFRLQLLGQRFRRSPAVFEQSRERLRPFTDHWGPLPEDAYRQALGRADCVVSTSLHEFQGLAVLEAVAAGCVPLVPDRLAYRETIPTAFRYPSHPDDEAREASLVAARLTELAAAKRAGRLPPSPQVDRVSWARLAADYRAVIGT